eukprot:TRINITY_DN11428_c0_g2_i1.p1 TRINITY_DN11428_c0_g2~~TRINITY_DN11428_c0_g2_i1.p1  ORF type:complete len:461 (+),score=69.03 TRINITY_DN11428_c0_g2_i1:53-1435(+)
MKGELRSRAKTAAKTKLNRTETGASTKFRTSELGSTQISIEDAVYDIADFEHPGGDIIKAFGGNDVTVQYKMIHHGHSTNPEYYLSKMKKVGILTDYKSAYKFDTPFEREIKEEVFKIVQRGKEFATPGFLFRVCFYVSLMASLQFVWVYYGSSVVLAIAFGFAQAFIGLNVQHDANHGAVSKNPMVNAILGWGADFIGGSKYNWIEQHWTHHSFTNDPEKDGDALSAEPMMLFNDYPLGHPSRRWYHKFQAFFYLPVLSFYWMSSVLNPQILDLNHRGTSELMNWQNDYIKSKIAMSLFIRGLYIVMNVFTPFFHHDWRTAVYHIWIMSSVESLALSVLFSLSHNFEDVERYPTNPYKASGEPVCWFKAQVETSSTYGGFIAGCITGGLNFQVEHHLFPRMCSAWYPFIAPKVREICKKHGVRYSYYPYIWENFIATLTYMHKAGTGGHWEVNPLSGKA